MKLKYFLFLLSANWVKTVLFNFRMLPFCDAIHFPVIFFGRCDILCGKNASLRIDMSKHGKKKALYVGNNLSRTIGMFNHRPAITYFCLDGELHLTGENIFIANGCMIYVKRQAKLTIGEDVLIQNNTKLHCANSISIKKGTGISWESQIFDTNMHYMIDESGEIRNNKGFVDIGDYCWIGNRCTIQKGTILPNGTIVASNSIVNKDFSKEGSSVLAGVPAKVIKKDLKRIFDNKLQSQLDNYFFSHPEALKVNIKEI